MLFSVMSIHLRLWSWLEGSYREPPSSGCRQKKTILFFLCWENNYIHVLHCRRIKRWLGCQPEVFCSSHQRVMKKCCHIQIVFPGHKVYKCLPLYYAHCLFWYEVVTERLSPLNAHSREPSVLKWKDGVYFIFDCHRQLWNWAYLLLSGGTLPSFTGQVPFSQCLLPLIIEDPLYPLI